MELIKLEDQEAYKGKRIICIGGTEAYLYELCERYDDIAGHIAAVLEDHPRSHGTVRAADREIPVHRLKDLRQCELRNAIILITDDYYNEYFQKLCCLLEKDEAVERVYFFANRETEYELAYRARYGMWPLEDIIVFRSGPHAGGYVKGMDFSDNARALFEYMLSAGLNGKYKLVWVVRNPEEFQSYEKYQNVFFLPFTASDSGDISVRELYYKTLCLAKYFFFTDAYGFVRNCRPDQVRVQLWHGCGYKKRLNTVSCEKRYDFMTVTSPLYARLHAEEFGLKEHQMLVTGCAKTDWLFEAEPVTPEVLGIPWAHKYIFWLPTYRFSEKKMNKPVDGALKADTGLPLISDRAELDEVNRKLEENDMVLVIKPHPFQDVTAIHVKGFSKIKLLEQEILLEKDIQMNQILGMADALISDYSSAAVDYLIQIGRAHV